MTGLLNQQSSLYSLIEYKQLSTCDRKPQLNTHLSNFLQKRVNNILAWQVKFGPGLNAVYEAQACQLPICLLSTILRSSTDDKATCQ